MILNLLGLLPISLVLQGIYGLQITTTTRQSINGIGASGAWWVNDVALFPMEVRQNVSELLLNQSHGTPVVTHYILALILTTCMQSV